MTSSNWPVQTDLAQVTGGVDTYEDTHAAAAVDSAGRVLGSAQQPADAAGYAALLSWLRTFGVLVLVGVEGTGVYGAGLAGYLQAHGVPLVEVDRPDRKARRWQGKSDPVDAEAAARAALTQVRTGTPKQRDGRVEALRVLRVARRCAVAHRAELLRRLKALVVTAPEPLRHTLRKLPTKRLLEVCVTARPDVTRVEDPTAATTITLRSLARRHAAVRDELDGLIGPLGEQINPQLLGLPGVGPGVAGQLLVTAGQNSDRLRFKAAFAMLCGVAPLPASSGKTTRHRLTRGGAATPTARCGASSSAGSRPTHVPAPTPIDAPPKD